MDHNFKLKITKRPGGETLLNCYQCGTCTAGCPVSELDESFSPRAIMNMAILGLKDRLFETGMLFKCSQCHTCVAHCPQDARPADVIRALRAYAVEQGLFEAIKAEKLSKLEMQLKQQRLEKINQLLNSEQLNPEE